MWTRDSDGNFFDADYDENKGLFTYSKCEDVAPVIEQNLEMQKDSQNGFFCETRDSRHIGEIPEIVYYRDILPKFKLLETQGLKGDDLRIHKGIILRKYLNEHPEYMTVSKMVHHTVNETHIQVK
jgi:hypothetical protein